ncbi:MAG: O-methyltransferase [Bacteroidales bacterium]|nr:O-methyltransferase [Bacteroidales bacterium]MDD3988814.1 O-methyltransferase [Bacteroidales bacterium]MDD4639033.1 O-methyltransferase [Bacteroidales bacterium]
MRNELDHYIENNSCRLDDVLVWLERETNIRTNRGRMLSGATQGRFLELFSTLFSPRNILEIGTFTGYSAVALARGLPSGGSLDTIEKNDELEPLIREAFRRGGVTDSVNLILGDALDIIPSLNKMYDLVYIDGNKREYPQYYRLVYEKVLPGGYILADNVLWDGKVCPENKSADAQTAGIISFNSMVVSDPGVKNFILPLRDGINIIRKL